MVTKTKIKPHELKTRKNQSSQFKIRTVSCCVVLHNIFAQSVMSTYSINAHMSNLVFMSLYVHLLAIPALINMHA